MTWSPEVFGMTAVAIFYYLVQNAKRAGLLRPRWVPFVLTGVLWILMVELHRFLPAAAEDLLLALGGWAATAMFHGAVKAQVGKGAAPDEAGRKGA
jgi:hypothetical protein